MIATCELDANGAACGVMAVGRCHRCHRAFCASHRAYTGGGAVMDLCAACQAADTRAQAEAAARRDEAAADLAGQERTARATSGPTLARRLSAAGVPTKSGKEFLEYLGKWRGNRTAPIRYWQTPMVRISKGSSDPRDSDSPQPLVLTVDGRWALMGSRDTLVVLTDLDVPGTELRLRTAVADTLRFHGLPDTT